MPTMDDSLFFDSDLSELTSDEDDYVPLAQTTRKTPAKKAPPVKKEKKGYTPHGELRAPRMTQYAVNSIHDQIVDGAIDLDPPYQRDVVWPESKQIGLIDSLFRNYYIPPVIFAVKSADDGSETRVCIDGKQRLTSVQRFLDGLIPHRDSVTGKKYWYKKVGSGARTLLPPAMQHKFTMKQIVCMEYQDINDDQEREIFQRVQLGVALTPAERMQAITGPRPTFIQEIQSQVLGKDGFGEALEWGRARGRDFQGLASIVFLIEMLPTHHTPISPTLDNWLARTTPVTAKLRADVLNTCQVFLTLTKNKKYNGPFHKPVRVSPIEFVMIGVLIYQHRTKLSLMQLSSAIQQMRADVRSREKDVRTNSRVSKALHKFITEKVKTLALTGEGKGDKPAASAVSTPTLVSGGKRKRQELSDSESEDSEDSSSEKEEPTRTRSTTARTKATRTKAIVNKIKKAANTQVSVNAEPKTTPRTRSTTSKVATKSSTVVASAAAKVSSTADGVAKPVNTAKKSTTTAKTSSTKGPPPITTQTPPLYAASGKPGPAVSNSSTPASTPVIPTGIPVIKQRSSVSPETSAPTQIAMLPPSTPVTPSTTVFIKRDPDGDQPRPNRLAALRAAKSANCVSPLSNASGTSNQLASSVSTTQIAARPPPPSQMSSLPSLPAGQGASLPSSNPSSTPHSIAANNHPNGSPGIGLPGDQNLSAVLAAAGIAPTPANSVPSDSPTGPSSIPGQPSGSFTQNFLATHGVQNQAQSSGAGNTNGWAASQWQNVQNSSNNGSLQTRPTLPADNNLVPSLSRTPTVDKPLAHLPAPEMSVDRLPYSAGSSLNDSLRDRGKDYDKDYGRSSSHDYDRSHDLKREQLGYRSTKGYDGYDSRKPYRRDDYSPDRRRGRSRTQSRSRDRCDNPGRDYNSSRRYAYEDRKRDWSRSTHRNSSIERDNRDRDRSRWDSSHGRRDSYRDRDYGPRKPSY